MNLTVIAVGRLNAAYYRQAAAEYEKRLGAFCRVHVAELAEEPIAEKNAGPAVIERALEKEGRAILAAVPKGAALVALCVEGGSFPARRWRAALLNGPFRACRARRSPSAPPTAFAAGKAGGGPAPFHE